MKRKTYNKCNQFHLNVRRKITPSTICIAKIRAHMKQSQDGLILVMLQPRHEINVDKLCCLVFCAMIPYGYMVSIMRKTLCGEFQMFTSVGILFSIMSCKCLYFVRIPPTTLQIWAKVFMCRRKRVHWGPF